MAGVERDVRLLKRILIASVVMGLAARTGSARPAEPPPVYELNLVHLFNGPETEFVFVIGNTGFRSLSSFEAFLATRPAGTTLRWSPGCVRLGGEPLLSSETEMEEFRAFCREHQIDFVLVPSG